MLFGAIIGIYLVNCVGRRKLLIIGHALIAILHILSGAFNIINEDELGVIICIILFIIVY